jgi:hypothetical protein
MICIYASLIWNGPLPEEGRLLWKRAKQFEGAESYGRPMNGGGHILFRFKKVIKEYFYFSSSPDDLTSHISFAIDVAYITTLLPFIEHLLTLMQNSDFHFGYAGIGPSPIPALGFFDGNPTTPDGEPFWYLANGLPIKNNWMVYLGQEPYVSSNKIRNVYPILLVDKAILARIEPFLEELQELGVTLADLGPVKIMSFPKSTYLSAYDLLYRNDIIVEKRPEPEQFFSQC